MYLSKLIVMYVFFFYGSFLLLATNLCFGEKNIYTLEILAAVMNQLVEQTPLPTLLMRTVIQSIAMYPKLLGYAMNIMQRLINKQVIPQTSFVTLKNGFNVNYLSNMIMNLTDA